MSFLAVDLILIVIGLVVAAVYFFGSVTTDVGPTPAAAVPAAVLPAVPAAVSPAVPPGVRPAPRSTGPPIPPTSHLFPSQCESNCFTAVRKIIASRGNCTKKMINCWEHVNGHEGAIKHCAYPNTPCYQDFIDFAIRNQGLCNKKCKRTASA
jgi:hypothetical protein